MDTHTDADTPREGTNNNNGSETCDEAEEEACSGNIVGTNNDDDSDTVKDLLESNTAQEESYVEGSGCTNNDEHQEPTTGRVSHSDLDNDMEDELKRIGPPPPDGQEDALSSNSNNTAFGAVRSEEEKQEEVDRQGDIDRVARQHESSDEDEKRGAHVLNHPSTGPGEQIDPRDRKMPAFLVSERNKQHIQTLGPVGAFGEGGGEQSDPYPGSRERRCC
jgi:hypothetical protein